MEDGGEPLTAEIRGTDASVALPGTAGQELRVVLREDDAVVADSGLVRFVPLPVSTETAKAFNDGDAKVPAKFALTAASFDAPAAPAANGLHLTYEYGTGWKFVRVASPAPTGWTLDRSKFSFETPFSGYRPNRADNVGDALELSNEEASDDGFCAILHGFTLRPSQKRRIPAVFGINRSRMPLRF